METRKIISVIVPVYNVEQYIEQCIKSIINQTYLNLDIILVDDGSTDSSGQLCDKYANEDSRVTVIHTENGGQSKARNKGLSIAKGEYIGFVDSDDWIDSMMYEKMIQLIESKGADIIESNFEGRHGKAPEEDRLKNVELIQLSGREALTRQLDYRISSQYPGTALWPKLFKREIIEGLQLPEGLLHEEYEFLTEAFLKAEKYIYLNEILYHRTIRDDSTTGMKFSKRAFDKLAVFRLRNQYLEQFDDNELFKLSVEQEYILMLNLYGQAYKNNLNECCDRLVNEIHQQIVNILKSDIDTKRKLKYHILNLNPKLYGILYRIMK